MLAALQRGVKGGKWFSLIDKVYRLETLELGWAQVEKNAGAAGVDRMSVERFAQGRQHYLAELAQALGSGAIARCRYDACTYPKARNSARSVYLLSKTV